MLTLPSSLRVYAAVEPVELRKGFDALAILVRARLAKDPRYGSPFVFFDRRFDRAEVLVWTPSGWCLVYVLTKIETGTWPHGRLHELLPDEWAQTAPASALRGPIR